VESTTEALTLTEAPALALSSEVVSVENIDDESLRVIVDIDVTNDGDVRVDDVQLEFAIRELFPDGQYRIDGLLSNDLDVNEAFAAEESTQLLAPEQSIMDSKSPRRQSTTTATARTP